MEEEALAAKEHSQYTEFFKINNRYSVLSKEEGLNKFHSVYLTPNIQKDKRKKKNNNTERYATHTLAVLKAGYNDAHCSGQTNRCPVFSAVDQLTSL